MKKKGFTLSEVLIAVGIIGVMSAIMASTFNHAKPDKAKIMYLKAYDALTTAVGTMVNDSTLFRPQIVNGDDTFNIEDVPLFDTSRPVNPYYYDDRILRGPSPGNQKFARVLYLMLKGDPTINGSYSVSGDRVTFTTGPSVMNWEVIPSRTLNTTSARATFQVNLTIDNDRNFSFCVHPTGEIQALDPRGKRYIANRRNIHDNSAVSSTADTEACSSRGFTVTKTSDHEYNVEEQDND